MEKAELLERARRAISAHKAVYYRDGAYTGADFWDYAEIFEIIEDYYEVSGDRSVFGQYDEMYRYILRTYSEDWSANPFNDDIMWLVIALTRAYLDTGREAYLQTARRNFDLTYVRAYSDALGGGLFWRIEKECKNTCVNCPASVAAQFLARASGDASYVEKARVCLDWAIRMMFEPESGKVYDCIRLDGSINRWSSTYNQGTFIGACQMMHRVTGERTYLAYAGAAARYVRDTMYSGGVMDNEESGNDLPGFKGILARYIRRYAAFTGETEYTDWLRLNADSCWNNRNSHGIMWTQLAHKTEERTDFDVFSASAAVSVVVNAAG